MIKRFVAAMFLLLLVGCASTGGEKVDDFTKLSVGYGWLNIDDVDANRLHSVVIFQHRPHSDKPYYHVAVKEFEGGYLYYSFAFPNGAFAAYSAEGQSCLGFICSNTIYSYNFGKQGDDVAALLIEKPGVYHFGDYALQELDTGFFEQSKFDVVPVDNAPSEKQMLEEILKDTKDNPVVAQRIQNRIDQL